MNAKLQGFLSFLDLMAEGQRRQVELVAGRRLEPVATPAPVVKFPLTGHQKPHLFQAARDARVTTRH